ncbi:hypothetical protein GN956_G20005 [Arapaima gigas]
MAFRKQMDADVSADTCQSGVSPPTPPPGAHSRASCPFLLFSVPRYARHSTQLWYRRTLRGAREPEEEEEEEEEEHGCQLNHLHRWLPVSPSGEGVSEKPWPPLPGEARRGPFSSHPSPVSKPIWSLGRWKLIQNNWIRRLAALYSRQLYDLGDPDRHLAQRSKRRSQIAVLLAAGTESRVAEAPVREPGPCRRTERHRELRQCWAEEKQSFPQPRRRRKKQLRCAGAADARGQVGHASVHLRLLLWPPRLLPDEAQEKGGGGGGGGETAAGAGDGCVTLTGEQCLCSSLVQLPHSFCSGFCGKGGNQFFSCTETRVA